MEIENEIRELVSIIVPVYNVAAYLDECVQSLVEQTYSHIEILLINDGSTDDSWEHCQAWGERDSRVRCFTKQNEGLGPTRNFGVTQAKGEYLIFVDSNDWVDKHFVEEMYRGIKAENVDIAECDFYRVAVDSGLKTITHVNGVMKKPFTKEGRLSLGNVIQWKINHIHRLIKRARFPVYKTFDGYDFCQTKLPPALAKEDLLNVSFIEKKQNLVLYGSVGLGKTHMAIAAGVLACKKKATRCVSIR